MAAAGIACALALLLALGAIRHGRREAEWPRVQGSVQETRTVIDYWVPASLQVEPQPVWKAEYKVAYFAGRREYASWFDCGIRGETKEFVAARAKQALTSPGFSCAVKYNPARPEVSVADCR